MPRAVLAALAFLAAAILGWGAAMAVYVLGNGAGLWVDRDGGVAMAFAFMLGPFSALTAGIAAVLLVNRRPVRSPS